MHVVADIITHLFNLSLGINTVLLLNHAETLLNEQRYVVDY